MHRPVLLSVLLVMVCATSAQQKGTALPRLRLGPGNRHTCTIAPRVTALMLVAMDQRLMC
jgi:hypothetical protein